MTAQEEGEEQGKLQVGGGSHCRVQEHPEGLCWTNHSLSQCKEAAVRVAGHSKAEPTCTWGFPVGMRAMWAPFLWATGGFFTGWTSHTTPDLPAAHPHFPALL